jgi:hypothetical protein
VEAGVGGGADAAMRSKRCQGNGIMSSELTQDSDTINFSRGKKELGFESRPYPC